ncbi:ABC-type polysaccharide/polyol phosphate transport system, ATPase component [Listeria fleischmannii FSL S10-1203]|uniref:ABC-type polysaccharide/polyol phosphate transport system, ATPase component n=1 Tax=Listeria fleischmannii FSL S10-1203 TaxID=1265822 RepID=W7DKJ8_9LIST|nr:ABC-type polysaccharide/polyol phosphate transport system, ATPase component [Listeria fleischmannii FSL S10-1203]
MSHSLKQIREVCDKVAWLHYGQLKQFGASDEVCLEYSKFIHHFMKKKPLEKQAYQKEMILHQKRERPGKFKKEKQRFPVILFFIFCQAFFYSV